MIDEIIGHQNPKDILNKIFSEDLESGAFLLSGSEGTGKKKVALWIVQKNLCKYKSACGNCSDCNRILKQEHESLCMIDVDGPQVKIEDAERVLDFLKLKSLSERRFVVINDCHKFNLSVANTLLKTIEEPPAGLFFFLISSRPSSLPKTILSRCRQIKFSSLSPDEIRSWISHHENKNGRLIFTGQPGLIESSMEEGFQRAVDMAKFWIQSWSEGIQRLANEADKQWLKNKSNQNLLIKVLEFVLRDILVYNSCRSDKDILYLPELADTFVEINSDDISKLFEHFQDSRKKLYLNPDFTLWLETIFCRKVV